MNSTDVTKIIKNAVDNVIEFNDNGCTISRKSIIWKSEDSNITVAVSNIVYRRVDNAVQRGMRAVVLSVRLIEDSIKNSVMKT